MLVDLSQAVGDYLQNVFVMKLNGWVLLGYAGQALFTMRFVVQWIASERARGGILASVRSAARSASFRSNWVSALALSVLGTILS